MSKKTSMENIEQIEMQEIKSKSPENKQSGRRRSLLGGLGKSSSTNSSIRSNRSAKIEHTVVFLPANFPSCPPGLEKLIAVDHLFVRQGIRNTEPPYALISKTKFEVLSGEGKRCFLARESSDSILKLCCRGGCGQPFQMSIKDRHSGYEILSVNGHPDCYGAMAASISQNGMNLGFLNEELQCCSSNYIVIDAQGNEIFRIYDVGGAFSQHARVKRESLKKNSAQNDNDSGGVNSQRPLARGSSSGGGGDGVLGLKVFSKEPDTRNDNHKNPQNPNNNNNKNEGGANSSPEGAQPCSSTGTTTANFSSTEKINEDVNVNGDANTNICASGEKDKICRTKSVAFADPEIEIVIDIDQSTTIATTTTRNDKNAYSDEMYGRQQRKTSGCQLGIGRCLDSCVEMISGGTEFDLYSSKDGQIIGRLSRHWEELYDRYLNLVDCFGVSFPKHTSVRHKALLLATLFVMNASNQD